MKKIKTLLVALIMIFALTGCKYIEVEQKTLIDYRYSAEHVITEIDNGNTNSYHYDEKFELLYEYTYADGHTERRWETCTRFEYARAKEELGEIEP